MFEPEIFHEHVDLSRMVLKDHSRPTLHSSVQYLDAFC